VRIFSVKKIELNSSEKIITELRWLMREELSSWNIKHWLRAYFVYGLIEFIRSGRRVLPDYSGSLNCFINPQGAIFLATFLLKKSAI
jgi:hypothetical protein